LYTHLVRSSSRICGENKYRDGKAERCGLYIQLNGPIFAAQLQLENDEVGKWRGKNGLKARPGALYTN
jgi:hypothetical protein